MQFDVYVNPSRKTSKVYPYLLDIQSAAISEIVTRIVVPLSKASDFNNENMTKLVPVVIYEREKLLLLTPQISSVPAKILKTPIGSLEHLREEIIDALDFAITGI
jgi:toxin CcdB